MLGAAKYRVRVYPSEFTFEELWENAEDLPTAGQDGRCGVVANGLLERASLHDGDLGFRVTWLGRNALRVIQAHRR